MASGTWSEYVANRKAYLEMIAYERSRGRKKYLHNLRLDMVACRATHYAKGRQRRYNLDFSR